MKDEADEEYVGVDMEYRDERKCCMKQKKTLPSIKIRIMVTAKEKEQAGDQ